MGGDTNGDGGATSPAPGDWRHLNWGFAGSGGTLEHVVVRYAGTFSGDGGAIRCYSSAPARIANFAILDSAIGGIELRSDAPAEIVSGVITNVATYGVESYTNALPATFTGNTITGCGTWPIRTSPDRVDAIDPSNALTGNGNDGVFVYGATLAAGAHAWPDLPVPFYLDTPITIPAGATLTLPPGAILKMNLSFSGALKLTGGTLNAIGTAARPIVFTSLRDDAHGGDTNGDGGATLPAAGNWESIHVSPGYGSLEHVEVRYGGYSDGCAVCQLSGGLTRITDSTIADSSSLGLKINSAGTTEISRNLVTGCAGSGIDFANGTVPATFSANTLTGNGSWPIEVDPRDVSKLATDNIFTGNVKNGGIVSVTGALDASGTAAAPVVFTSERDDSVGGDTNGDGAATTAAVGDWYQIVYYSGSSGVIDHATIRYAGRGNYIAVYCYAGAPSQLTNTTIADAYQGFRANSTSPAVFSGNRVEDCTSYGIYFSVLGPTPPSIGANTVTGCGAWPIGLTVADARKLQPDNVFTGNGTNVILLAAGAMPAIVHSWNRFDAPYYLSANQSVPAGAILVLAPGSIVKMWNDYFYVYGSLVAEGTAAEPVSITSYRDDSVGGDSNGDGSATSPAPGDWSTLQFQSSGVGSFKNAAVRYGGSSATTGMISTNGAPTVAIEDSVVSDSLSLGIKAYGAASSVSVKRSVIERNDVGIHASLGANPVIGGAPGDGNSFYGNATFAVQNAGSACISAHYNDWGAPDGPYDYGAPAPLDLVATPYNTVVDLAWSAVTGASGYTVHRSLSSGGPYTKVNPIPLLATSFRDTGLVNGTAYTTWCGPSATRQRRDGRRWRPRQRRRRRAV